MLWPSNGDFAEGIAQMREGINELRAIVDHSLTDLAHGIWFSAQLMQAACGPQCKTKGEGMREHFGKSKHVAAPRQRLIRVAELS